MEGMGAVSTSSPCSPTSGWPDGGKTYVIGNLIEQGPQTDNSSLLGYLQEGPNAANPSDTVSPARVTWVCRGGAKYSGVSFGLSAVATSEGSPRGGSPAESR